MNKKGIIITQVSFKTYLLLSVIATILIMGYFYVLLPYSLSNINTSNPKDFSSESCPKSINTERYMGTTSWFDTKNSEGEKFSSEELTNNLQSGIKNGEILIDMLLACKIGQDAGENTNYVYCGTDDKNGLIRTTPKEADSEGVVQLQQRYGLKYIIDIRTCKFTGTSSSGINSFVKFECDYVDIGCKLL